MTKVFNLPKEDRVFQRLIELHTKKCINCFNMKIKLKEYKGKERVFVHCTKRHFDGDGWLYSRDKFHNMPKQWKRGEVHNGGEECKDRNFEIITQGDRERWQRWNS